MLKDVGERLWRARRSTRISGLNVVDAIGVLDGHQPMGDAEDSAPPHHILKGFLHHHFAPTVQRAGGLVQQEHFGVLDDGSCDGHPLLLPPAELRAGLAHLCIVALGEVTDDVVDEGVFAGLNDLFPEVDSRKGEGGGREGRNEAARQQG